MIFRKTPLINRLCLTAVVLFGSVFTAQAKWLTIHNDFIVYDTEGNAVHTRSGTLRKFGDAYYWYGSANGFKDQTCYKSTDLVHWTNKGVVIQAASTNRMDVLYNDSTKLYVMFLKTGSSSACDLGIATSPTPDGKFTLVGNNKVQGSPIGDMSVWEDTDGKAYLAYVWDSIPGANSGGVSQHALALLSPDYQSVSKRMMLWNAGSREGMCVMKAHGLYYYISSLTLWTQSTASQYYTASNAAGPWTTKLQPILVPGNTKNNSWDTQSDFVFNFNGPKDTVYMYGGDRWERPDPARLGDYAWLPISFTPKDTLLINYYQDWEVDPDNGTWRAFDLKRNLALHKTATASSSTGSNTPNNVTDSTDWKNYSSTKWVSGDGDAQWIQVDLGSAMPVNRVILKWDSSYAKAFKIQVATDTADWKDVYTCAAVGPRSITDQTFATTPARYVRMSASAKGGPAGYTLFDFMVLNDTGVTVGVSRPGISPAPSKAAISFERNVLRYAVPSSRAVKLEVLDSRGKRVAVLADGFMAAGRYEAALPANLGHGMYLIRLAAGGQKLAGLRIRL
jgi:hypothetical protein